MLTPFGLLQFGQAFLLMELLCLHLVIEAMGSEERLAFLVPQVGDLLALEKTVTGHLSESGPRRARDLEEGGLVLAVGHLVADDGLHVVPVIVGFVIILIQGK